MSAERISLANRLTRGGLLLDGGTGTELFKAGLRGGQSPEGWVLERPDPIRAVSATYVAAGSEAIFTCTFGANRVKLKRSGVGADADRVNRTAVALAREAAGNRAYVLGDIGPTGELLEPYGDLPPEEARAVFREQARALVAAGVDGLVVESFGDPAEAAIAVAEAKAAGAAVVLASLTFGDAAHGLRTMTGATPEQAAGAVRAAGADVVGVNCGAGVEDAAAVIARMRAALPGVPLFFKPNAGVPRVEAGVTVYPLDPGPFAAAVRPVLAAGLAALGGCCGTGPDHIRAVAALPGRTA